MRALVAVGLVTVLACAVRPRPPIATIADAQRASVPLADLDQGRTVLIRKCSGRHLTPLPHDYTPTEWPAKIGEMAGRSKLAPHQVALIEQYLVTMTAKR